MANIQKYEKEFTFVLLPDVAEMLKAYSKLSGQPAPYLANTIFRSYFQKELIKVKKQQLKSTSDLKGDNPKK